MTRTMPRKRVEEMYRLSVRPGTIARTQRLRRLYRLGTGQTLSMAGWFEQFIVEALARQEEYLRRNGIPIPPDDDCPSPGPAPFVGLPDDSPIVDD
jgi:hypothetical protein